MEFNKKDLRDIEVKIDERDKEELVGLLNDWCGEDYKIFGGIFDLIENIKGRIFLMNFDKNNNCFMTFDDHGNIVYVDLYFGDKKAIAVNKYDERFVYDFQNSKDSVFLEERLEERLDNSVMKRKRKIHKI